MEGRICVLCGEFGIYCGIPLFGFDVSGDAGSFLVLLAEALSGYKCPGEWTKMLRDRDMEKEEANRQDYYCTILACLLYGCRDVVSVCCIP